MKVQYYEKDNSMSWIEFCVYDDTKRSVEIKLLLRSLYSIIEQCLRYFKIVSWILYGYEHQIS